MLQCWVFGLLWSHLFYFFLNEGFKVVCINKLQKIFIVLQFFGPLCYDSSCSMSGWISDNLVCKWNVSNASLLVCRKNPQIGFRMALLRTEFEQWRTLVEYAKQYHLNSVTVSMPPNGIISHRHCSHRIALLSQPERDIVNLWALKLPALNICK